MNNEKYGHFSADGNEFQITRPDTPMPWTNILCNGDYGAIVSQAGGGYSWKVHAGLNRITRWEQDLVRDEWGKFIFLRDADTGEFWSVTTQPCGKALTDYLVTHGQGYTRFIGSANDIRTTLTMTVPMDDPCELWELKIENLGQRERNLEIYTYSEMCLGAAPDWHREFHRIFIDASFDEEKQIIFGRKHFWDLPGAKVALNRSWPYVMFHAASVPVASFTCDKRDFIGRNGSVQAPSALTHGELHKRAGRWGDPVNVLQLKVAVSAGATHESVFMLGAANDAGQVEQVVSKYRVPGSFRQALESQTTYWSSVRAGLIIDSPDEALNTMANGWLQYQAIAGRIWGRNGYYQVGGAYGFRDQLQDSLIWLLLAKPEKTLEQIRLHAQHQFQSGIVLHWWHPLAESGLTSDYSDDLLWLPFVTYRYILETGDAACLDEVIPFYDGGSASLKEHCERSFTVALERFSERGLPLILGADWNDGLNAVGVEGRGESVWMSHFLFTVLNEWASLPTTSAELAKKYTDAAAKIQTATEEHAWDGEWYFRATNDAGQKIGSHENVEGRIFLNAQTWAVLSGLASPARAKTAMDSARKYLFSDYGPLLLAPGYSVPDSSIGYLTRYAPSTRENGGVYVHAACWAVLAERKIAGASAAYKVWRSFCPAARSGQDPDQYMAEPYVMPGNVDGPTSEMPGKAGWTWYTGSASWNLRSIVEGVFGVTATMKGLKIDADLPEGWDGATLIRQFRGCVYSIRFERAGQSADKGIYVDGGKIDGSTLPLAAKGSLSKVVVRV